MKKAVLAILMASLLVATVFSALSAGALNISTQVHKQGKVDSYKGAAGLDRTGRIYGWVLQSGYFPLSKNLLPGVTVKLYNRIGIIQGKLAAEYYSSNGYFSFTDLPWGETYYIQPEKPGWDGIRVPEKINLLRCLLPRCLHMHEV